jgi:thioredoxin reductase (NADPH)
VTRTDWDLIIIGGGPAGLAAAQYGARANLRTILLEGTALGGQGLLIDMLENYPGVNQPVSGYDFAEAMHAQALKFGATIEYAQVSSVTREGPCFTVHTEKLSYRSMAVILATGAEHRRLGLPGEAAFSSKGISYCATCDGPFFRGQPIMVVGGGDAACDEAEFLSKLTDRIVMVHRRDKLRAQPAVADRVLSDPHISMRWNSVVREIKGDSKVRSVLLEDVKTGAVSEEKVEAVFIFIGSDPRTGLFPDAELDESGYIKTDSRMQTSIPGLFAAGDVRDAPFRQVVVSAADGAIAAHCASQYMDSVRCPAP